MQFKARGLSDTSARRCSWGQRYLVRIAAHQRVGRHSEEPGLARQAALGSS